ncbi:MAG: hypothetical protein U0531_00695 [Dehalococcoidia bacterium]
MIGEENRGWYIAATVLDFERSGIDRIVRSERTLNSIVKFAREFQQRPAADRRSSGPLQDRRHEAEP